MRTHLKRKEVDDVLGGKEAWANVDKTDSESITKQYDFGRSINDSDLTMCLVACPKCDHRRAYFRQMQIRSADEPMTTF